MQTKIELCQVAYHDDSMVTLWLHRPNNNLYTLPTVDLPTDPTNLPDSLLDFSQSILKQHFPLDNLSTKQIQIAPAKIDNQSDKALTIPIMIYLTQEQALHILDNKTHTDSSIWNQQAVFLSKTNLPDSHHDIVKNQYNTILEFINDDLQAHSLKNIHWLLPNPFTAKQISSMLTSITGRFIKRNNIRRDFLNQTKVVGKDHSHVGYPANLFQYDPTRFNIADKPKLKGDHKI